MRGTTLPDLLAALLVAAALAALSLPRVTDALDHWRTRGAASYLSSRVALTRMQAVRRRTNVALRFEPDNGGTRLRAYADGNGDGVRSVDITSGVDAALAPGDRLEDLFPHVTLGFVAGATLVDGSPVAPGADPVRFGPARMVSCTPEGTATAGTIYVRGQGPWQYAIVVLGATGRTRLLQFEPSASRWVPAW
jgi:Tfp pilus assembly protein FimT